MAYNWIVGSRSRYAIALSKYFALLLIAYLSPGQACPVVNGFIQIAASGYTLTVELAANRASQTCGLAFRDDLPEDRGMLFVFPQDQILSFWMKNTFIPLSIAFLDRDGRILEMHDMDPRDPSRRYISKWAARYALEVNQGWFTDHDIAVGDRVEFEPQGHSVPRTREN